MRILAIFLCICFISAYGAEAQEVQPGRPAGAVLLVVDGLGAPYVYPELAPYTIDGTPLEGAKLHNLTCCGARVIDVRAPVPETSHGHSVLITGNPGADPDFLGMTILDLARSEGYLCLAVLERGDTIQILQRMDGFVHLPDNAINGAEPTPGGRVDLPPDIRRRMTTWYSNFGSYTSLRGLVGYKRYNLWAMDAATDLVENAKDRRFLLMVNVGAVDSAGHNLGSYGYLETISALDAPLGRLADACRRNNVLLVVTADHGMSFVSKGGSRGGHASGKYAERLESLRIPLVFIGPGIEDLSIGGVWSQADVAPTMLQIMGIGQNFTCQGRIMPVMAPGGQTSINQSRPAPASASGLEKEVTPGISLKEIIGSVLILIILLAGSLVIAWIWRGDEL